jgi:hypothetical protein
MLHMQLSSQDRGGHALLRLPLLVNRSNAEIIMLVERRHLHAVPLGYRRLGWNCSRHTEKHIYVTPEYLKNIYNLVTQQDPNIREWSGYKRFTSVTISGSSDSDSASSESTVQSIIDVGTQR